MTLESSDVRRLTAQGGAVSEGSVPRPHTRRATRVVLPVVVIIGVLAVGAFAAWRMFAPLPEAWVMPVVSRPTMRLAGGESRAGSDVQSSPVPSAVEGSALAIAPGWVEPDPCALTVSALTGGVVREVLVLEGQRVAAGDVVARLDPTDAALMVRRAEAERDVARADEGVAAAAVRSAEAREKEIAEEIAQGHASVEASGGQANQDGSMQLKQRRRLAEEASAQARLLLEKARAQVRAREVVVEQAALDLSRREVRSPVSGVVVNRLVEPGSHVGMGMGMQMASGKGGAGGMPAMPGMKMGSDDGGSHSEDMSGAVLRLFDPAKLQVRTEVGAADSVRIVVGMTAQMTTDAAPDIAFRGVVSRIVPAVDVQKNTVDVKVAIENSEGVLRPGMQMRVKFFSPAPTAAGPSARPAGPSEATGGASRIMVPTRGLQNINGSRATLFVVAAEKSGRGERVDGRDVTVVGEPELGYVEVNGPVSPGERVVVRSSTNLETGIRVQVVGELRPGTN